MSQYLRELENTNYEQDDGVLTSNFSIRKRPFKTHISQIIQDVPVIPLKAANKVIHLTNLEMNSLYNVSGYIMSRIRNTNKICNNCLYSAESKTYNSNIKYSKFVHLKCYRTKTLFFVNNETFQYFYEMEVIIRRYIPYLKNVNCDLIKFFIDKMTNVTCNTLKNCHGIYNIIMKRFIRFRIKIENQKGRLKVPIYSSKTMARHSMIK